jgi:hypothetical protein
MVLYMPICCLRRDELRMSRRWWLRAAVVWVMVGVCVWMQGQTLAQPGWRGSGMTVSVWWKHAVVYAVDLSKGDGLKGVVARMDAMQALGADAVLLSGLQSGTDAGIEPAAGTMDDFDAVLREASNRSLRVLVELKPTTASVDVSGVARFWLSRGVAGFRLVSAEGDDGTQMRQLRAAAKSYVGERVMIGDAAQVNVAAAKGRAYDGPQLVVDASIAVAPLDVAAIRKAIEKNDAMNKAGVGVPMLATAEGAGGGPELGKVVATLLLSSRGGTMIREGQEGTGTGEDSLAGWYRKVSALVRANEAVKTGANEMLNLDDQSAVAWVRRPQAVSYHNPAVVFVCNMTDKPVTLSLTAEMGKLKLKGTFLRKLLRSDQGMGAQSLASVKLGAYGVYVGELLF